LREQFGASRVRLFGSLLYPQSFHKHSDIDLAVEGMDLSLVLKAWCAVSASAPDFEFDLVTPDECRPEIWTSIESEGIEL
jgi:predicted nucleotidyltransferase